MTASSGAGLKIIAHRGASGYCPENTMASFRAALDMKVAAVEFDVQQTKDGRLVVIHDTRLRRLAKVKAAVGDLTYEELSRFDVGSWFNPNFSRERVPRLEEVMELLGGKVEIQLEIKQPAKPYIGLEGRLLDFLSRHGGWKERLVVSSFHFPTLENVRRLDPELRLGWLAGVKSRGAELSRAVKIGAESVHIGLRRANAAWVARAADKGLKVLVYTANSVEALERLEAMGAHGAFSDFPDLLARARAKRRAQMAGV